MAAPVGTAVNSLSYHILSFLHMFCSLNSLKGGYIGDYIGDYCRGY